MKKFGKDLIRSHCLLGKHFNRTYSDKISSLLFHFSSLVLFSWANGFAMYMNSTLLTNVTSLFDTTNLISILDTVLTILQAVLYPIYSKLSDMYGRAYLYTAAIILYMVSYIVFACSSSYQDLVVCILSKEKFLSLKHTYLGWQNHLCFWLYWCRYSCSYHYSRYYQCR